MALAAVSSNVQRILTLRTFPAFSSLEPHELAVMAEYCEDCFFEKGEVIAKSGLPVTGLHLVVEGQVQIYKDGQPFRLMKERESVGGIASITMDPRGIDAVAVEDTTTLALAREDMEDLFEDHASLMLAVTRVLARTLIQGRRQRGPNAGYDIDKEVAGEPHEGEVDLMDRVFFLTSMMAMDGVSVDALADLAYGSKAVRFEKGDVLWKAGDVADHFVGIISGLVDCESEDGKQTFRFGASSTVGGMDAISGDPRWYGAVASTDVVGVRVEMANLFDLYEDNVEMGMAMMRVLAHAIEAQFEAIMRAAAAKSE